MVGRSDEARSLAEGLFDESPATQGDRSRFAAVVASQAYEVGNLSESLQWWHRALQTAEESGDPELVSRCAGQVLERTCDRAGFDSSLPLASRTRRAAARSGTAQSRAAAHLTFGRLEAKVGHHDTALRHFAIGRSLLPSAPNAWLSASLDLDASSVLMLIGDPSGAVTLAQRGAAASATSGWARGMCAAHANLACLFVALDKLSEADNHLVLARRVGFSSSSPDRPP